MSDPTSAGEGAGPTPPYYPAQPKSPEGRKGPGCFFWGCLGLVAFCVVGIAATVGLGYYALVQVRDKFTDTQPMALPQLELNEEERHAVRTRFDDFREALDKGEAEGPMVLTADEINALIAEGDPNDPFRDALRVDIEDDRIVGQLSLPMDRIGMPMMGGRYLNATAELSASIQNGELDVRMESATVKGEPLPAQVMTELRRENLAAEFSRKPDTQRVLRHLEAIEIRDDRLFIVPREGDALPGSGAESGPAGGGS